ncbi:hypothetical protein [Novosphingobium sp. TCA1]|uniref:hypothetical protein n=1 Tax=Novosphingobium sp. TCA1 TaxID=2682474 RepID=UPI001307B424|nr:hypothetical protein [Novosphingobium sp. TCA1]GFE77831.1 hypothetical protein NTCA1_54800 [Novosphingobium sp. TCA1]
MFNFADIAARHALSEGTVAGINEKLEQIYNQQFRGNTAETYERFSARLVGAYDSYFETLDGSERSAGVEMAMQRYDYAEHQDDGDEFDDSACSISGIDIAYCHCGRHE